MPEKATMTYSAIQVKRTQQGITRSYTVTSRVIPQLLLLIGVLTAGTTRLAAQTSIYPNKLYGGMNVITITASNGLDRIEYRNGGSWAPLITGTANGGYRVISSPTFTRCSKSAAMRIQVNDISRDINMTLRVTDCKGSSKVLSLDLSERWSVYRENFGRVLVGATACHTFQVDSRGGDFIVEKVVSPSPLFTVRYIGRQPPVTVPLSGTYRYDVCFTPTKPGQLKMPILVYIRRKQPAGGFNTFIVADTAYVTVVVPRGTPKPVTPKPVTPKPKPVTPKPVTPRPKPVTPKPKPVIPKPLPPPPPPPMPTVGEARIRLDTLRLAPSDDRPMPITDTMATTPFEIPITDPTTHRVMLMPTARSVDSGRVFISNYELAGWLFGFGLTDRLTVLGGALYVPPFIKYNFLVTAGVKYEFLRDGYLRVAVGGEFNYSQSDISSIVLGAPYAVASFGDDDRRVSVAGGYSWRRHTPIADTLTAPFTEKAAILAVGGDYRIGGNWKIAGEAFLLEDTDYQPLILTLRYFTETFAIDGGMGIDLGLTGEKKDGLRIAPVISATWVW